MFRKKDFKIKIGPFNYEVKFVDKIPNDGDKPINGGSIQSLLAIRIRDKSPSEFQDFVIVHEIIHAMLINSGLAYRMSKKDILTTEDVASALDIHLYTLLKDHKVDFTKTTKGMKKGK